MDDFSTLPPTPTSNGNIPQEPPKIDDTQLQTNQAAPVPVNPPSSPMPPTTPTVSAQSPVTLPPSEPAPQPMVSTDLPQTAPVPTDSLPATANASSIPGMPPLPQRLQSAPPSAPFNDVGVVSTFAPRTPPPVPESLADLGFAAAPVVPPAVLPQPPQETNPAPSEVPLPASFEPSLPAMPSMPLPPADPAQPPAEGEKSPLEILEDILAGASAEKQMKEDEEAKKKEAAEKEAAEKKIIEEKYQQEVAVKIGETNTILEEAKQERAQVEIDLESMGKVDASKPDNVDDDFAIHQLTHETRQTNE